jgi:hypothetical protein
MKRTRFSIAPVAVLVVLGLLTLLWLERRGVAVEQAGADSVVKVERAFLRDNHARAAFLIAIAVFSFLVWTVMEGSQGDVAGNAEDDEVQKQPDPGRHS